MLRVMMLETRRGSEDGFVVRRYFQGKVYDLSMELGVYFLRKGWALEIYRGSARPEASR